MLTASSAGVVTPHDPFSVEATEKQLWEILKSVPGLNVTYGTVRCIVYVIKKDDQESTASAIAVAKGAVQTAVVTAGVFTAPVTIPVVAGGALTGIAAKSVSDAVEIIVFFVTNSDQFHEKNNDEKEKILYDKIKNVTGVGALYSAVRVPVYLLKRNKQRTIESGLDFVTNSGDTAVQVGVSMIPNIDTQLQRLIERTARCAIKCLAKKVMSQVSNKNLPLDQGLQTIAKVENDCQAIVEATTTTELLPEEQSSMDATNTTTNSVHESHSQNDNAEHDGGCFRFLCCAPRCQWRSRRKINSIESQHAPVHDKILPIGNTNGHLIILTE